MKLKEYFQAYEFEELFPYIGLMYPKARHQRNAFRHAYELLLDITPIPSKKYIHYQIMEDPSTNEMLGKDVRIDPKVDLSKEEIVANCLLNTVLIGRHPKQFDSDFNFISR